MKSRIWTGTCPHQTPGLKAILGGVSEKISVRTYGKREFFGFTETYVDSLADLGIRSFGNGMERQEVVEHLFDNDILYVAEARNKPIAFAGMVYQPKDKKVYLSAALVDPLYRGNNLYKDLTGLRVMEGMQVTDIFYTRTQNPIVEKTIRSVLDSMVENGGIESYQCSRQIKEGVFGRRLTDEIPLSGDKSIDCLYSILNYDRGDAFILEFKLRYSKEKESDKPAISPYGGSRI